MNKQNKRVDWQRVERMFRAGVLSIAEISRECAVPEANIRYHAKRLGWKRDLTSAVRRSTRTKMVENLAKVFDGGKGAVDQLKNITDEQIIEEASRTQVEVVRQHQKTLGSGHSLTMRMLNELDASTTHRGELEDMIKSTVAPRRQGALMAAISLAGRATVMRDLANAARVWIAAERQAFNIADDTAKDSNEQRKVDEMTAEQLRAEIVQDAQKLGIDLSELAGKPAGVLVNGNGKMH